MRCQGGVIGINFVRDPLSHFDEHATARANRPVFPVGRSQADDALATNPFMGGVVDRSSMTTARAIARVPLMPEQA